MSQDELPIIPGRGLVTAMSQEMRHEFLNKNGYSIQELVQTSLNLKDIQYNIESNIGSVEIPIGIVGPLLFNENNYSELVYTCAGTLEGALVASMTRGAKAISMSGGFQAEFVWQKMVRAPMFLFENQDNAGFFIHFVTSIFQEIKSKAESYSNHAQLNTIEPIQDGHVVHLRFIYETGDASGQNMTTTCTWHAVLEIVDRFHNQTDKRILDYVIEGNAASDKKISKFAYEKGRGIRVKATCILTHEVLKSVLRTTATKMLNAYYPSRKQALSDGMHGYNINIANAIAAIYVATGQDLACIHESSSGFLDVSPDEKGLRFTLDLHNLVVGTVGGGTHLPKQSEALELMGCKGPGKVERFAKLIAGFSLGLEISTFSAIVSGEFAKSHEKLGRNKPVNWITRSDVTKSFIQKIIGERVIIESMQFISATNVENGILTYLSGKGSKKIIGFEVLDISFQNNQNKKILLKSKGTDQEVIKGLHTIASSIDPELSDLIAQSKDNLEYAQCHLKESIVYAHLESKNAEYIPFFYGANHDKVRENHMLLLEYIDSTNTILFNSENSTSGWNQSRIQNALETLHKFQEDIRDLHDNEISKFEPWKSKQLYEKLIDLTLEISENQDISFQLIELKNTILNWENEYSDNSSFIQPIHNDFNTRNLCLLKNNQIRIYDFELAIQSFPHRDVVEFLSFTLHQEFTEDELDDYLNYYLELKSLPVEMTSEFMAVYNLAIREFILTRALFYEVAGIVVKYEFAARVLRVALRMERLTRKYVV